MSDIPISIKITAEVSGSKEVAELAANLEKIQSVSGKVSTAISEMGTAARRTTPYFEGLSKPRLDPENIDILKRMKEMVLSAGFSYKDYAKQLKNLSPMQRTMAEDITKGAEGLKKFISSIEKVVAEEEEWETGIGTITSANKRMNLETRLTQQALRAYSKDVKMLEPAITVLTKTTGLEAQQARAVAEGYRHLSKSGRSLVGVERSITEVLGTASQAGMSNVDISIHLGTAMNKLLKSVGLSATQIRDYNQALSEGIPQATRMLHKIVEQRTALRGIIEMQRQYKAELGAVGMATEQFTRDLFWTGLGMMFTSMSIARMVRRGEQLRKLSYTLATATISIKDAQKEYNEVLKDYGPRSEEVISANRRVIEAQIRLEETQASATAQTQQLYLSWMMLVLGAFPTFIRTGGAIMTYYRQMRIAQEGLIGVTMSQTVMNQYLSASQMDVGVKSILAAVSQDMLAAGYSAAEVTAGLATAKNMLLGGSLTLVAIKATLAKIAIEGLIGAATMGIGLLVSWGISSMLAAQSMREMEERTREMEERLTGHSLVDDLEQAVKATKSFKGEISDISYLRGAVEAIGTVEIRGEPLALRAREGITIGISGPWYVREEADITRIGREISRQAVSKISKRGG